MGQVAATSPVWTLQLQGLVAGPSCVPTFKIVVVVVSVTLVKLRSSVSDRKCRVYITKLSLTWKHFPKLFWPSETAVVRCKYLFFCFMWQMNITPRKAMSQGSQDSYVTRMLLTQKSTASGNEGLRVTVRLTITEVTCRAKPEAVFIWLVLGLAWLANFSF